MGWPGKQASEPEIEKIAGRYEYQPETGEIVGPAGKPLTPVFSPWAESWRVGVYVDGKSHRVNISRLAFALTNGRWPVGMRHKNGNSKDVRAENLAECSSPDYRLALKQKERWPGTAMAVVSACAETYQEKEPDTFDPRWRRGALRGVRSIFADRKRVRETLKSDLLTARDREKLTRFESSLAAMCRVCENAVQRDMALLKGKPLPSVCDAAGGRFHRRKARGPSRSIRRAARR